MNKTEIKCESRQNIDKRIIAYYWNYCITKVTLLVLPAFQSHAQTTQPRCPVKEKTLLLWKHPSRQNAWWLNTHFSLAKFILSFTLKMNVSLNSQSRMFRFYRPVNFTKYRFMNIHTTFHFFPSTSVVLKYDPRNFSCNFKKKKRRVFQESYLSNSISTFRVWNCSTLSCRRGSLLTSRIVWR